jgi:hypothetical protein
MLYADRKSPEAGRGVAGVMGPIAKASIGYLKEGKARGRKA